MNAGLSLEGASWETIGWIGVDAGTCAFGDAAALGPGFALGNTSAPVSPGRVHDFNAGGLPLVAYDTREDNDMPVEVARDGDGAIIAARLCATNDVGELAGTWHLVGELKIESGRCLAADPYCSQNDYYRFEFDIPVGRYVAEVFDYTDDAGVQDFLALRIRRP